jgi:hypothetical protein
MSYQRKTQDRWEIQQNWGFGHGWEDVYSADSWKDARRTLKEYRENQPGTPVRAIKRREPIGASHVS